jgi:transcriptional regulatory protein RtcR
MKPTIALGLIGAVMDAGTGLQRWQRWRPTVDLCRHPDLPIQRLELLCAKKFAGLADQLTADIAQVSPQTAVRIHPVEFRDPWDFQEVYTSLHDFARHYPFNPDKEDYLIHITTGTHVAQICLFLLTEAHYLPARLVQTAPPGAGAGGGGGTRRRGDLGTYSIIDLDLSKYDAIASRFHQEQTDSLSFLKSGIETRNPAFNRLIEQIERVAIASKSPLLLMGPTGSGKSLLARRIYDLKKSRRHGGGGGGVQGAFVEVNCATIRGDAAMSALFGHVKGAFTGALQNRPGLLRAADGGMLFLDEIGELGADEQAMLLRALEDKVFTPLGADKEVSSNFQLIAGTNRDLAREVAESRLARGRGATAGFREDLFARINLWTFRLPPLCERTEDIEPNIRFELDQFARRENVNVTFNKEARERFLEFAQSPAALWLGNFRDLSGAIQRLATLATGARITLDLVEAEIAHLQSLWQPLGAATVRERPVAGESAGDLDRGRAAAPAALGKLLSAAQIKDMDRFDRVQFEDVLAVCRQSATLSDAGRTLFAASRRSKKSPNDADRLRKYLARFDLSWQDIRITA